MYEAHTNAAFLLPEVIVIAQLRLEGLSWDQVTARVVADNVLQLERVATRRTYAQALKRRFEGSPRELLELLEAGGEVARAANLYAVLLRHRLLRELLLEVIVPKRLRFDALLRSTDVGAFMTLKLEQSETLSGWTDATLSRARQAMLRVLVEAGVLRRNSEVEFEIMSPMLPNALREVIQAHDPSHLALFK